jgi:hypothetical protein
MRPKRDQIDWGYRVDRNLLYRDLGFKGDHIPDDPGPARREVVLKRRDYNRETGRWEEITIGRYTVVILPPGKRFNSSSHRLYAVCDCGKEIPTGRLHQHKPFCRAPRPDAEVRNEGTIFLVTPRTEAAEDWIEEHTPPDTTWFGPSLVVEHRYVEDLVEGMRADGLVVV